MSERSTSVLSHVSLIEETRLAVRTTGASADRELRLADALEATERERDLLRVSLREHRTREAVASAELRVLGEWVAFAVGRIRELEDTKGARR